MARALEVHPKVIALRNPIAETQIAFEKRAHQLHDELAEPEADTPSPEA